MAIVASCGVHISERYESKCTNETAWTLTDEKKCHIDVDVVDEKLLLRAIRYRLDSIDRYILIPLFTHTHEHTRAQTHTETIAASIDGNSGSPYPVTLTHFIERERERAKMRLRKMIETDVFTPHQLPIIIGHSLIRRKYIYFSIEISIQKM